MVLIVTLEPPWSWLMKKTQGKIVHNCSRKKFSFRKLYQAFVIASLWGHHDQIQHILDILKYLNLG